MSGRSSSSKIATPDSAERGRASKGSKFELVAELGRGGMATVYLARAKNKPERLLVLKQLRAELAENPEFLAMFLEEARLAGKLLHPNVVETYEVGKDDGTYYIAMEYLDGLSLQAVLAQVGWKGALTFPMQVWVLIQALAGLEHAYSARDDDGTRLSIVHRDVSPPNIIVTFDGKVKLVDFGIAKAANSHVETRTGLIKGKLTYMAPEQAQSGDVDNRTDIYSVGVMLWQAAAGTRRWKGLDNTEVLKRLHAGEVSESPFAERNGLPRAVNDIVLKAIAPEPDDRYESAAAFRSALEALLRSMHASVGAEEVGGVLAKLFAENRKRASEVMRLRLAELDAKRRGEDPHDSVTAIRSSPVSSGAAQSGEREVVPTSAERPRSPVPKEARASAPASPKRATATDVETIAPARRERRRSLVVPIAIVGVGLALALAYLAWRQSRVSPAPAPAAPAAASTTLAAPLEAPAPATNGATTTTATAPLPTAATPLPHAVTDPQPVVPHGAHPRSGTKPAGGTVTQVAPATTTTPAPTTAPAATAPKDVKSADDEHPSLDKNDPWKHNVSVEKTDPWGH